MIVFYHLSQRTKPQHIYEIHHGKWYYVLSTTYGKLTALTPDVPKNPTMVRHGEKNLSQILWDTE